MRVLQQFKGKKMNLTKNFSLIELTSSETAVRKGIDNTPSQEVVNNLKTLCDCVMQPLRDWYGKPINITSGYRSPKLNKAIGGSTTSDHCYGQAIDFTLPKEDYEEVFSWIIKNVPFDQAINEFNFQWIHVSFRLGNNRKQVLKAYKNAIGQTKYRPY